jgi:hypothetical protein
MWQCDSNDFVVTLQITICPLRLVSTFLEDSNVCSISHLGFDN